jgi:hypothetical protein
MEVMHLRTRARSSQCGTRVTAILPPNGNYALSPEVLTFDFGA